MLKVQIEPNPVALSHEAGYTLDKSSPPHRDNRDKRQSFTLPFTNNACLWTVGARVAGQSSPIAPAIATLSVHCTTMQPPLRCTVTFNKCSFNFQKVLPCLWYMKSLFHCFCCQLLPLLLLTNNAFYHNSFHMLLMGGWSLGPKSPFQYQTFFYLFVAFCLALKRSSDDHSRAVSGWNTQTCWNFQQVQQQGWAACSGLPLIHKQSSQSLGKFGLLRVIDHWRASLVSTGFSAIHFVCARVCVGVCEWLCPVLYGHIKNNKHFLKRIKIWVN